jgi:carbon storage regulator
MLVLTRHANESFFIGDRIRVVVLDCRSGKVRIGIDAPESVKIIRTELLDEFPESAQRLPVDVCQGCYQFHCICLPDD